MTIVMNGSNETCEASVLVPATPETNPTDVVTCKATWYSGLRLVPCDIPGTHVPSEAHTVTHANTAEDVIWICHLR